MNPDGLPLIAVIADDLTGALASAVRLRQSGLATVVEPEPPRCTARAAQAVVVNLATRGRHVQNPLADGDSSGRAENAAVRLKAMGCRLFELRVDEDLRGNPAAELRGLLSGAQLEDPCVIAVPAYPACGRITRDGAQVCFYPATGREDEHSVAARLFPSERAAVVNLASVRAGSQQVAAEIADAFRAGVRHFVIDSSREDDLETAAIAVAELRRSMEIVTISSGAWLRYHPVRLVEPHQIVLVVMGSATDVNDVQFKLLAERPGVGILSEDDMLSLVTNFDRADQLLREFEVLVVASELRTDDDATRLKAASKVAGHAETVLGAARLHGVSCRGVVASGSYTAERVAEQLKADQLEPSAEPMALCPVGTLSGGEWAGLPIAVKGGLIGNELALVELVDHLSRPTPLPSAEAG